MSIFYSNYSGCGYNHSSVGWGNWWCAYNRYQPNCNVRNDAPVANNDVITANQGQTLSISTASLLANDTDKNGDKLTITSVQAASHGTVALVNGNIVFTPATNYVGPASFSYTISDGKGGISTATVCLTLKSTNAIPDAVNDNIVVNAPGKVTIDSATLLSNDSDANGDKLTIISVQAATHGTVALVNGKVEFVPTAGYSGPATFTYTVSDGKGGVDTATVNLTIPKANTGPDAVNDIISGDEDIALVISVSSLLVNDYDADGDALTITSVQGAVNGTVSLVSGQIVFTPASNYNGPASFTYTVTDGKGGTDTATVNLNINPVNDAPVAVDDGVFTVEKNGSITLTPAMGLNNDYDVDGDAFFVISKQDAVNGTVTHVNGNAVFTPTPGYTGPASFTYTISDGKGGISTATVHINVVGPANLAPDAVNDTGFVTNQNTAITISPATLLANDSDADGDALQGVSLQDAVNGTVAYVNGNVIFTPTTGYTGQASFTYTITDGQGGFDTATVTINVVATNDAPDAVTDALSLVEDTPLTISPATLLANDTDANGDTLSITSVQGAVNGTVALVSGQIVFTPNANYFGPASFTYTISDGKGGVDTATVNLNVTAAINIQSGSASVSEEGLIGGLPDSLGTVDVSNSNSVSGTLTLSDADGVVTGAQVTLTAPISTITSGGVAVTWSGSGTQLLTAMAGTQVVATLSINNAGQYSFNLLKPIDHDGLSVEDVKAINFTVNASDADSSSTAVLTINVEDDAPKLIAKSEAASIVDTNVMITLDISGSMNQESGIGSQTRLESAVQSINNLLDTYDSYGDVRVRLVTFSSTANAVRDRWLTVDEAKAELGLIQALGATNYDEALGDTITAFADPGKLNNAQTVSYFFSDGNPNRGAGDETELTGAVSLGNDATGIQAEEEATWKQFLTANQIKSYAIGMGTDITNPQALEPVAYDGQAQVNLSGVLVTNFSQLDSVLAGTTGVAVGQLITDNLLTGLAGIGADGGYVKAVTIEGVTYTYNHDTQVLTSSGGLSVGVFDSATSALTVSLASGGVFLINMESGRYQYTVPTVLASPIVERFEYTVSDLDGDIASSVIDMAVDKTTVTVGTSGADSLIGFSSSDLLIAREGDDLLSGGAGKDNLLGGDGKDTLSGGIDNDQLSGGLGADTFVWTLGDISAAGIERDTIKDFDMVANSDVLNLKDLLVGEAASADSLDNYLHFNFANGDTTVYISTTGQFADAANIGAPNVSISSATEQKIVLTGVDLTAGFTNDTQVIQSLLTQQKLVTDQLPQKIVVLKRL